jgi:adenylate kinase
MPLFTAFGINGVGKDTVLRSVQETMPQTRLISETKLLMFGLGILSGYDETVKAERDHYAELEGTSQPKIYDVEGQFPDILSAEAASLDPTIMTSHLIPAQLLQGEVIYLVKPKPECIHKMSRAVLQFVANPESVMARRDNDNSERDRGNLDLNDLIEHQHLCDEEWVRLQEEAMAQASPAKFVTIENEDLATATHATLAIINRVA